MVLNSVMIICVISGAACHKRDFVKIEENKRWQKMKQKLKEQITMLFLPIRLVLL